MHWASRMQSSKCSSTGVAPECGNPLGAEGRRSWRGSTNAVQDRGTFGKWVSSHISLSLGTLPEVLVQLMDPVYYLVSLRFQDEFVLSICHALCSDQATLK